MIISRKKDRGDSPVGIRFPLAQKRVNIAMGNWGSTYLQVCTLGYRLYAAVYHMHAQTSPPIDKVRTIAALPAWPPNFAKLFRKPSLPPAVRDVLPPTKVSRASELYNPTAKIPRVLELETSLGSHSNAGNK